jgi:hypothetical protein
MLPVTGRYAWVPRRLVLLFARRRSDSEVSHHGRHELVRPCCQRRDLCLWGQLLRRPSEISRFLVIYTRIEPGNATARQPAKLAHRAGSGGNHDRLSGPRRPTSRDRNKLKFYPGNALLV